MPWTPSSSIRFTKKARSKKKKRQWSSTANAVLRRGGSEGSAVRIANAAVKRKKKRSAKSR